jgi:uncharacterized repeat protein (TIGR03803 family)
MDGLYPQAGVIDVGGTLYGTTSAGGAGANRNGTAFSLAPTSGTETVLHSFHSGGTDGYDPRAGLIGIGGILYGTTWNGGPSNGIIFSLDPTTSTETILYHFQSIPDGFAPGAGLISGNGTLYGTTYSGGTFNGGTVFTLDPTTGTETVLHAFRKSPPTGGLHPSAGLLYMNGILYGTAFEGGDSSCSSGCGTVFSINSTTGAEKVLHSFKSNGTDGFYPAAGLVDVGGTLYGTTTEGGAHGGGTVFAIKNWQ